MAKKPTCKYLVMCTNHAMETRTEQETLSASWAQRFYADAIKSGLYSTVVLRKEERLHGYAIKFWSKENGEVTYCR